MEDIKTKRKGEGKKRRERNWAESTRLDQPTSQLTISTISLLPYLLLSASAHLPLSRSLPRAAPPPLLVSLHQFPLPPSVSPPSLSVPVDSAVAAVPEPCARAGGGRGAACGGIGPGATRWRMAAGGGMRARGARRQRSGIYFPSILPLPLAA